MPTTARDLGPALPWGASAPAAEENSAELKEPAALPSAVENEKVATKEGKREREREEAADVTDSAKKKRTEDGGEGVGGEEAPAPGPAEVKAGDRINVLWEIDEKPIVRIT